MRTVTASSIAPSPIPLARLLLPAAGLLLAMAAGLYLAVFDHGLVGSIADVGGDSGVLHALFHDGRHVLGVPCH